MCLEEIFTPYLDGKKKYVKIYEEGDQPVMSLLAGFDIKVLCRLKVSLTSKWMESCFFFWGEGTQIEGRSCFFFGVDWLLERSF